jgi:plastocyanin
VTRSTLCVGLLLAALAVVGSGCKRAGNELQPDQVLRDSLGLGDEDRVHRVRLGSADNREIVQPPQLTVRPGDYVEFVTQDRRVHALEFTLEELPPAAAEFMRRTGQQGSPPLVQADARFVVSFAQAPPGTYPYVVIGNGEEGRGAIVVSEEER